MFKRAKRLLPSEATLLSAGAMALTVGGVALTHMLTIYLDLPR